MSEKATHSRKLKKAAQMLLFKRHFKPGVKSWELKRALGKDYMEILDVLDIRLEPLGLQVRTVYEGVNPPTNPTNEHLKNARFYITIRDPMTADDLRTSGWRIDDVAALAVILAFIISKQGKSLRSDVENTLRKKFPKWRVESTLNRFLKQGYITEDDDKMLYLDWRARAEVDAKMLLKLVIGEKVEG